MFLHLSLSGLSLHEAVRVRVMKWNGGMAKAVRKRPVLPWRPTGSQQAMVSGVRVVGRCISSWDYWVALWSPSAESQQEEGADKDV